VLVIARLLAGVRLGETSIGGRASAVGGLAAFVLAVGVLSGCAAPADVSSGGSADASGHDDADVAFATAMVPHHEQAVAMTRLALDHAGSTEVKELARQMAAEQLPEIVQLRGLLSEWGRLPAPGAPGMPDAPGMQGMSGMHDGTTAAQVMSAGMMTDQQMRDLSTASGPAFDRLFLRMMIKHHGGAVAMAAAELSDGENADAQLLAENISDSQQAQVMVLLQMLADG
jgi:uncharacterized protein (DUF305 family)